MNIIYCNRRKSEKTCDPLECAWDQDKSKCVYKTAPVSSSLIIMY